MFVSTLENTYLHQTWTAPGQSRGCGDRFSWEGRDAKPLAQSSDQSQEPHAFERPTLLCLQLPALQQRGASAQGWGWRSCTEPQNCPQQNDKRTLPRPRGESLLCNAAQGRILNPALEASRGAQIQSIPPFGEGPLQ